MICSGFGSNLTVSTFHSTHRVRQTGAGMLWEENTVGLDEARAGGWSGVRGNYCSAGVLCVSMVSELCAFVSVVRLV